MSWGLRRGPVLALALSCAAGPATAATRRVPQDHATVQAAINAAQAGDLVLVAPGTYVEQVVLDGKDLVLASEFLTTGDRSLVERTILDGALGNTITVRKTITGATQIVGFTIRGGDNGLLVYGRPVIRDCVIAGNGDGAEYRAGGGVLRDCVLEDNADDGLDSNLDLDVVIERCTFRHNSDDGLEIRVAHRTGPTLTVVVRDCLVHGNDGDGIQIISEIGVAGPTNRLYRIEGSLLAWNGDAGLGFLDNGDSDDDFRAASFRDRVHLFGNTILGQSHGVSGGDDLVALNNLFLESSVTALKGVDGDSIAAYNGFSGNAADATASHVDLATSVRADPLLDAEHRLLPGSPAIDAGTARYERGGEVVLDLDPGAYLGPAPDLGRAEFVPGRGAVQEIRVARSTDDAEEAASRSVSLTDSGLELAQAASGAQTVGLRFEGLEAPAGGTIARAYLQFRAREERSGASALVVRGEASDQAETFSSRAGDLSGRPRTEASAAWAPAPWPAEGEGEDAQRTSDLAAVLREIVERPGWGPGFPVALFVTGTGDRLAQAHDARPEAAPLLHVAWACPADADGDGVCDPGDVCPGDADPGQADRDRDGRGDACDCAPGDPGSFGVAAEVAGVAVEGGDPAAVSWEPQDATAGAGTVYDVAGGLLSALRAAGHGSAACLAAGLPGPGWTDPVAPPAGDGRTYLPRARNACGTGTYGPPELDASPPCP